MSSAIDISQGALYADLLACAVATGDMWSDGEPRSTDNDFCAVPLNRPQIVQRFGAPTRAARQNVVISPTPQADSDRTKCIQGSSSAFRTTP